jgi:hypothetical protein
LIEQRLAVQQFTAELKGFEIFSGDITHKTFARRLFFLAPAEPTELTVNGVGDSSFVPAPLFALRRYPLLPMSWLAPWRKGFASAAALAAGINP